MRNGSMLLTIAILAALPAAGATIRLPTRYVYTTYKVHNLTGLTSDEREKEKVIPTRVDIRRITGADGAQIEIVCYPKKNDRDDISGIRKTTMSLDSARALVAALRKAPEIARELEKADRDEARKLFEADDVVLKLETHGKGSVCRLELDVLEAIYVLQLHHAALVADTMEKEGI